MRIQDMKSGAIHLDRKPDIEREFGGFESRAASEALAGFVDVDLKECEIESPMWAVVSFEKTEENGLTYGEASQKIAELETRRVPGLCIVTDEAAARIRS